MESNNETSTTGINLNPLMARYKFDVSLSQLEDNYLETLDQSFTDQLLKKGRIFLTTELCNLQYSQSSLQYFSSKIADDLTLQEAENLNSVSFSVQIEPIKSNMSNLKPLKITIEIINNKNKKKQNTIIYIGVFYSWRSDKILNKNFLNLPFLFCISSQKVSCLVNSLFEKYFGCQIKPVTFPQHEFKWLMTLITEQVDESFMKDIQLIYQINPNEMKISFSLPFNSLKEIWNNIHDEDRSQITYEEVIRLHTAFEEHIMETYGFDLSHFHLKRFTVPDYITIDVSGKVHILTINVLDLILRFLKDRIYFD